MPKISTYLQTTENSLLFSVFLTKDRKPLAERLQEEAWALLLGPFQLKIFGGKGGRVKSVILQIKKNNHFGNEKREA